MTRTNRLTRFPVPHQLTGLTDRLQHTLSTRTAGSKGPTATARGKRTQSKQLGVAGAPCQSSLFCKEGRGITVCHAYKGHALLPAENPTLKALYHC